ncbi:hypothetical protein FRB95_014572 [Tulasnella sp. JGI-2019a]|nr:hypothetical protein FRB95_014572 [Tulasnella sp. JGI-2019a]
MGCQDWGSHWEAMKGHTGRVNCVAISPDGTTIVSGSNDKTLQLWDVKTGEGIGKAMGGHTQPVSSIDSSLDGKHILSVSQGAYENLVWSWENQTQLLGMQFQQGMTMLGSPFRVSKDGWVLGSGHKQLFWLPAGLRMELVGKGNIIAIVTQEVVVLDVPAYIS